jgi:hypothetical protein
MTWARLVRGVWGVGVLGLLLLAVARAEETSETAPLRWDDTGRIYFYAQTGFNFLGTQWPGDVEVDTPDGVNVVIGGGAGYNISRHWGVELQIHGIEPDLRSDTRGKITEVSTLTFVPAARLRWPLEDGRLVPYVSGGVGVSINDVNDAAKPFTKVGTDSSTIVGSLAAGVEYFLSPNIAAGLELRSLIYPDQDAEVAFQDPRTGRVRRFEDSINLTALSLLAHLRVYPGQPAGPDGSGRRFLLADHGPFDTDEMRVYLAGLFGYDFLFDKDFGGGVKLRDKGGDFNLSVGGALGVNLDRHWGGEIQLLVTELNLRTDPFDKFAELSDFVVIPTLRWRYPLLDGRLVPFATAGIGVAFLDVGDRRPVIEIPARRGFVPAKAPRVEVDRHTVVGSVGVGIEYFLNRHLSAGLSMPFHIYPNADTVVRREGQPPRTGNVNLSGFLVLLQLKAYLP